MKLGIGLHISLRMGFGVENYKNVTWNSTQVELKLKFKLEFYTNHTGNTGNTGNTGGTLTQTQTQTPTETQTQTLTQT